MTRFTYISFLFFAVFVLAGCGGEADTPEAASAQTETVGESTTQRRHVRVETQLVEPTTFEDVIEITGAVEAYSDAVISAQSAGTIVYRVQRGSYVRRNGLIAQIDSTLMHASYMQTKAQVDAAQAQFDLADDAFKRQEPLFQDSIISAIEFESVRAQKNQAAAQLSQAQASLAQFREQLDNTRVVAPFSGTVETFFVDVGEQASPGIQIARVVNTQRVKVSAGVPERYANDIAPGSTVNVAFDAYGGDQRKGAVTFVGRAINRDNRTFPIEIRLENEDQRLKPEMVARVFLTRDELTDVLVIPQDAVPLDEEGHSVFVVTEEGSERIAERRRVVLGASYAGKVVVEDGLEVGDEVVVVGQYSLSEGDAVEVVNAESTAMAAKESEVQGPESIESL